MYLFHCPLLSHLQDTQLAAVTQLGQLHIFDVTFLDVRNVGSPHTLPLVPVESSEYAYATYYDEETQRNDEGEHQDSWGKYRR
ncbi:hypothetical protein ACFU44_13960 [Nocardia rhizosphaerihabitans]|uniref:hypothetical protein n=1 Tax=Nocardia rhizosphaerihabitans TaxID=1691570 RepID=UPI003671BA2B